MGGFNIWETLVFLEIQFLESGEDKEVGRLRCGREPLTYFPSFYTSSSSLLL